MPSDAASPADLNTAIAEDVRHEGADTIPPDLTDVRDYPPKRTLRRLGDADVSRLYRLWLLADERAREATVATDATTAHAVFKQTKRAFCETHELDADQLRSVIKRGRVLLHAAGIASAAVTTSQQTPQGALRDAESAPSTRETRSAAPDVSTRGAGVSASPRPAIGDGTRLLGGRVGALAVMLDSLTDKERAILARRLGPAYHEAIGGDDAAGVSAIASADDLREAAETSEAQARLRGEILIANARLDAYRARDNARDALDVALPIVRRIANAIPEPYADERTRITSALDLLREVLAALGVL